LSISVVSDRLDGNWNRILVAGADPSHFVISHLAEGLALMLIVFAQYTGYATIFLSPELSAEGMVLVSMLLFLVSINGIVFGLFFSIIMDSVKASMLITMFSAYPATFISGKVKKDQFLEQSQHAN
jgi:ABC-type multidrug transport system permease subunit